MAAAAVSRLKFDVYVWHHRLRCNCTLPIRPWRTYQWAPTGTCWPPSRARKVSTSQPMGFPPFALMFMRPPPREGSPFTEGQCHRETQVDASLWDREAWWAWGGSSFLDSCLHLPTQPPDVPQAAPPASAPFLPASHLSQNCIFFHRMTCRLHACKGFIFSKCFIIFNELILFSLGWLVDWLIVPRKKLKPKCLRVTCFRSPQANQRLWAPNKLTLPLASL